MRVKVVYLGGSRGQTGCAEETLDLPPGTTVGRASDYIGERHPTLAPLLESVRFARNFEFSNLHDTLEDGDELGVLPPVSGGAPVATLTEEALDPQEVLARVSATSVGATVLFVGTVRDHARGKDVVRLEYEVYGPMALRQLERIAEDCSAGATRVAIAHRYGRLEITDISVVIAAASPHRADAFDACRKAIEQIKIDVPIWKREITTDGETWVDWGGG